MALRTIYMLIPRLTEYFQSNQVVYLLFEEPDGHWRSSGHSTDPVMTGVPKVPKELLKHKSQVSDSTIQSVKVLWASYYTDGQ